MEGSLKCSLTGANGGVGAIIVGRRRERLPGQYFFVPEVT